MTGSSGSTTTSTSGPPPEVLKAYGLLAQAGGNLAQQPLSQYTGPMVAGFTPQQQAGFQSIDNSQGSWVPFTNAATQEFGQATTPLWPTLPKFDTSGLPTNATAAYGSATGAAGSAMTPLQTPGYDTLPTYLNPYTSLVTDTTRNLFNEQNAEQLAQVRGNAASQHAYGGDREAVAEALTAKQQQLAEAPVLANIQQQGFAQAQQELNNQQALALQKGTAQGQLGLGAGQLYAGIGQGQFGEFNTQQQQQLAAEQANAWLASQAAFGMGALGTQAQNQALTGAQAEIGAGSMQQQLAQEQMNIPYQQFLQTQAYPYQQLGFLSPIVEGTGSLSGGIGSTTSPGPSALSQIAGLGTAAVGLGGLFSGSGRPSGTDINNPLIFGADNTAIPSGDFSPLGGKSGGRVASAGGGRIGYAKGGFDTTPMIPGIGQGVPQIDLSYIPQEAAGGIPSSMGLHLSPETKTTSSGGGGGAGDILGGIKSVIGLAGLFKEGGRARYDGGGGIGGNSASSMFGSLPSVPAINLDYIVAPGPGIKGAGPPKPPQVAQAQQQDNPAKDITGLIGSAKKLFGDSESSSSGASASYRGGRIGFADGGREDELTAADLPPIPDVPRPVLHSMAIEPSYGEGEKIPAPNADMTGAAFGAERMAQIGSSLGGGREEPLRHQLHIGHEINQMPRGEVFPPANWNGMPPALNEPMPSRSLPEMSAGGHISFQSGGSSIPLGAAIAYGGAPPNIQQSYQQLLELPLDRLQQMAVQFPPTSSQGQLVAQALATKKATVGSGTAQAAQPTANTGGTGSLGASSSFGSPGFGFASSSQDYGGTSHLASGGAASEPGYVTPDELDPHPVVDHSGDTVKIRYPSEGKVLDLGLPPIREERPHYPAGGAVGRDDEAPYDPNPIFTGPPVAAPPPPPAPGFAPAAFTTPPGAGSITIMAPNGVALPQLATGATAQGGLFSGISGLKGNPNFGGAAKGSGAGTGAGTGMGGGAGVGGGMGDWFRPMNQYIPPGGGPTGPGGSRGFPSTVAFTPGMGAVISGLTGNTTNLPTWAGGPGGTPPASSNNNDAVAMFLSGLGVAKRGGRIGYDDGGPVSDDRANRAVSRVDPGLVPMTSAIGKAEGMASDYWNNGMGGWSGLAGRVGGAINPRPLLRYIGDSAIHPAYADAGDVSEEPASRDRIVAEAPIPPPPDRVTAQADIPPSIPETTPVDKKLSAAADKFDPDTGALLPTGKLSESGKLGEAVSGLFEHRPIGENTTPAWLPRRYDIPPIPEPRDDVMPATVLPPSGLGKSAQGNGGIGAGTASAEAGIGGDHPVPVGAAGIGEPAAPHAMVTPTREPPPQIPVAQPVAPIAPVASTSRPAGAGGVYATGDSQAWGLVRHGGLLGTTSDQPRNPNVDASIGRSPQEQLDYIIRRGKEGYWNGKNVVLSPGVQNDPSQAGLVQQQIKALEDAKAKVVGISGFTAVGAGGAPMQPIADQIDKIASDKGIPFGGIYTKDVRPRDPVHLTPAGYQKAGAWWNAAEPRSEAAPATGGAAMPGATPIPDISGPPIAPGIKPIGAGPADQVVPPAPGTATPAPVAERASGEPPATAGSAGPVTPTLATQAGYGKDPEGYAGLANYLWKGEASDFNILFGGKTFSSYDQHPADKGWLGGYTAAGPTHAAGLPQFQPDTWHGEAQKLGLTDFSPVSQIKGGLDLAETVYRKQTGGDLLTDFKAGKLDQIDSALHSTWTSLGTGQVAGPGGGPGDGTGGKNPPGPDQLVGPGNQNALAGTQTASTPDPMAQAQGIAKQALDHTPPEHRSAMAQWMNSPWFLVFLAGAGMLASKSPFPGVALGEGLLLAGKGAETMAGLQNKTDLAEARLQSMSTNVDTKIQHADYLNRVLEERTATHTATQQLREAVAASQAQAREANMQKGEAQLGLAAMRVQLGEYNPPQYVERPDPADPTKKIGGMWYSPKIPDPTKPDGGGAFIAGAGGPKPTTGPERLLDDLVSSGQATDRLDAESKLAAARRDPDNFKKGEGYTRLVQADETRLLNAWKVANQFNASARPPDFRAQAEKNVQAILGNAPGVPHPAAAAPATQPSAPATPTRPSAVPEGSAYSPSRQMWRDPSGKMYDASGAPAP